MGLGPNKQLRKEIIQLWNTSPIGGQCGIENTYRRIASLFHWKGTREEVKEIMKTCDIFQRHKYDDDIFPGLVQPLKVPETAWISISMDFVKGLPKLIGKSIIWVMVNRFTKYAHFIGLSQPYSPSNITRLFIDHIY